LYDLDDAGSRSSGMWFAFSGEGEKMTGNQTDKEVSQISRDILAYLARHPSAEDTLEGIVRWWLLEQKIRHQTSVVRAALSGLVERGILIEKRRQGVSFSYGINPERIGEAQELAWKHSIDMEIVNGEAR